jgi:hypothetical protein
VQQKGWESAVKRRIGLNVSIGFIASVKVLQQMVAWSRSVGSHAYIEPCGGEEAEATARSHVFTRRSEVHTQAAEYAHALSETF